VTRQISAQAQIVKRYNREAFKWKKMKRNKFERKKDRHKFLRTRRKRRARKVFNKDVGGLRVQQALGAVLSKLPYSGEKPLRKDSP